MTENQTNNWISARRAGRITSIDSRRVERLLAGSVRHRSIPFGDSKRQVQFWLPDVLRFIEGQPHVQESV
jgi:hypothetical protein